MDIMQIVLKKLQGKLSDSEALLFDQWINDSDENRAFFNRLQELRDQGKDLSEQSQLDLALAWKSVLDKYRQKTMGRKVRFLHPIVRYAAIFIGFLSLGYGYWISQSSTESQKPPEDVITLQLDNGEVKVISIDESKSITNHDGAVLGTQEGNQLDYSNASVDKIVYNTLKVPYGKRFKIVLSDGSLVNLNAGASLKYPVKFLNGQQRNVFLTGEAYFDVSEDKQHPFVVTSAGDMDVTVLGTSFNVAAYPEDAKINTVLVEGSVRLSKTGQVDDAQKELVLTPGYKAEWDKLSEQVTYEKVDTNIYTGWVHGKLVIKKMAFKNIIPKLQRHYNVVISNDYENLNNQVFTANFDDETITEVLEAFTEDTLFEYRVEGNKILISKSIN